MTKRIAFQYNFLIAWFERALAVIVFIGVIVHTIGCMQTLVSMN